MHKAHESSLKLFIHTILIILFEYLVQELYLEFKCDSV